MYRLCRSQTFGIQRGLHERKLFLYVHVSYPAFESWDFFGVPPPPKKWREVRETAGIRAFAGRQKWRHVRQTRIIRAFGRRQKRRETVVIPPAFPDGARRSKVAIFVKAVVRPEYRTSPPAKNDRTTLNTIVCSLRLLSGMKRRSQNASALSS